MSYSLDLLHQAEHLLVKEPRKPKQASLRRAISSAYYAVFHHLADEAAGMLVGVTSGQKDLRKFTARALNHGQMKAACSDLLKTSPPRALEEWCREYRFDFIPEFVNLSVAFRELQDERHRADYDLGFNVFRLEARESILKAEKFFSDWKSFKQNHREAARFFALALFLLDDWRKR